MQFDEICMTLAASCIIDFKIFSHAFTFAMFRFYSFKPRFITLEMQCSQRSISGEKVDDKEDEETAAKHC